MNVRFHFLRSPQLYAAELPDLMRPEPELSGVVVFRDVKRTIQYSPGRGIDDALSETTGAGETASGRGNAALHRRTRPPALDFASWPTARGGVWTHAEPATEGTDAIRKVAKALKVTDGEAGIPLVELGVEVSGGDVRQDIERDLVMFYASDDAGAPWSVRFADSGALGYDGDARVGDIVFATRATSVGVTVTCDGRAEDEKVIRRTADAVAATLRRT